MERVRTALALVAFLCLAAWAESPQELFKKANDAYAAGQFTQAVTSYEAARNQGLNNWILDYNLGNAYYKTGAMGKAVASYTRAFRKNSPQPDVVYNLNLALTKSGDPLIPTDGLSALFWRLFYVLPLNTLTILV